MSYLEEIKNISPLGWMFLVMTYSYAVATGVIFLFAFKPSIFVSLSDFKFLLLSLSLTLPVITLNALIYIWATKYLSHERNIENKLELFFHVSFILINSSIIFFIPIIYKLFYPPLSTLAGYRNALGLECGYILGYIFFRYFTKYFYVEKR